MFTSSVLFFTTNTWSREVGQLAQDQSNKWLFNRIANFSNSQFANFLLFSKVVYSNVGKNNHITLIFKNLLLETQINAYVLISGIDTGILSVPKNF